RLVQYPCPEHRGRPRWRGQPRRLPAGRTGRDPDPAGWVSSGPRWTSLVGRFGLRCDLLDLIGRDGDRRDRIRHRRCRWGDDRLVGVLVRVVEERQVVLVAVEDVVDDLLAAQTHEVVAFGAGLGEDLDPVVDVVTARGAAGAESRNVRLDRK